MAIDRPLDQGEKAIADAARACDPAFDLVTKGVQFLNALGKAAAALNTGNMLGAIAEFSNAMSGLSRQAADEHGQYLLGIVLSEVRYLDGKFELLSEAHRRFLNTDWIGLVLDAERKARQTRTKGRVLRLAVIVSNAAKDDPPSSPDQVEDMLRIAMEVDDIDVVVLNEAVRVQGHLTQGARPSRHAVREAWRKAQWRDLGIAATQLDAITGKLQSLSMLWRLEQPSNHNENAPMTSDFLVLQRGFDFIAALKERATNELE